MTTLFELCMQRKFGCNWRVEHGILDEPDNDYPFRCGLCGWNGTVVRLTDGSIEDHLLSKRHTRQHAWCQRHFSPQLSLSNNPHWQPPPPPGPPPEDIITTEVPPDAAPPPGLPCACCDVLKQELAELRQLVQQLIDRLPQKQDEAKPELCMRLAVPECSPERQLVVATRSLKQERDCYLSMKKGQKFELLRWEGCHALCTTLGNSSDSGWIPRTHLLPLLEQTQQVRVFCDFQAEAYGDGCIDLRIGSKLEMLGKQGDWAFGIAAEKIGWFPASHVCGCDD